VTPPADAACATSPSDLRDAAQRLDAYRLLQHADTTDPDRDPELDVTLSNGHRLVTFQIRALDRDLGTWTVVEPPGPRRILWTYAEALDIRRQLDIRIAARLAVGWVPVDAGVHGATAGAWPPDLAQDLSYLLETVTRRPDVVRAVDPTGQLWAAVAILRREARRCGVPAVLTRQKRAQQARRLGVLAEAAGDLAQAIEHYRRALALHPRVGVLRRLARLDTHPADASRPDRRFPRQPHARGRARSRRP
jgi:tetratricopeptide (TPR) repeat protein